MSTYAVVSPGNPGLDSCATAIAGRDCSRFIYLTIILLLRGYIAEHWPLSNGFETMQFMAWCALGITMLCYRRFILILPAGYLVGGLAMMVSMMGESNPQITPLMPVLTSPLLSIHVVLVMAAYTLLAFVMFNGIAGLLLYRRHPRQSEQLQVVGRILLYPAIFALAAGIFVGAIWANISWGRYWGWDPKEVWALITWLVYALALHTESLPLFRKPLFSTAFVWQPSVAYSSLISELISYWEACTATPDTPPLSYPTKSNGRGANRSSAVVCME